MHTTYKNKFDEFSIKRTFVIVDIYYRGKICCCFFPYSSKRPSFRLFSQTSVFTLTKRRWDVNWFHRSLILRIPNFTVDLHFLPLPSFISWIINPSFIIHEYTVSIGPRFIPRHARRNPSHPYSINNILRIYCGDKILPHKYWIYSLGIRRPSGIVKRNTSYNFAMGVSGEGGVKRNISILGVLFARTWAIHRFAFSSYLLFPSHFINYTGGSE